MSLIDARWTFMLLRISGALAVSEASPGLRMVCGGAHCPLSACFPTQGPLARWARFQSWQSGHISDPPS